MTGFLRFCRKHCLYLSWFVSIVALAGSLYLSEILHYEPCKLCWFQRIFMYPLVFMLGIATYKNDRNIVTYALPLSLIGGSVSLYHYALQKLPFLQKVQLCTVGAPCTKQELNFFGFVTIPFMALTAFTLISLLLWFGRSKPDPEEM